MHPDRWKTIEETLNAALQCPPQERSAGIGISPRDGCIERSERPIRDSILKKNLLDYPKQ